MTTYIVQGRSKIKADSATQFVQLMHKEAHMPQPTDAIFMVEVARWSLLQDGSVIRSDTAENFLADLIANKFVHVVSDGE